MKPNAFLSFLAATALFIPALRAETTSLELILDCSASMWNKLEDGRYRIDGAKEVLSDFIATTKESPDLHVGLRIYGSKVAFSKDGACEDSLLVVPVEGFERAKMLAAVKNARAIGATPLARSLELAKEDFSKAGVRRLIIFTDGEESCGGDVQAAMKALKEAGIDVDVRVIGIGLSQEATKRFAAMGVPVENVNSAQKLAEALGKAAEMKPQIVTAPLTLKLVKDGLPYAGATPTLAGALNGKKVELKAADEGTFTAQTEIGVYEARVGERTFKNLTVQQKEANEFVLDLTEAPKVELRVEPQSGGVIGGEVTVHFKGAKGVEQEFVTIAPEGSPDQVEPNWAYTDREKEGSVKIRPFGEPGKYEARFVAKVNGENVISGRSAVFELKLPQITLKVPETVPAATSFGVEWTGAASEADWIGWVKAGAAEGDYGLYGRPEGDKGTVTLVAPSEPGDYEIRYSNDLSPKVIARTPFKVVASEYSLKAPESIMAGTSVEIGWNAPKSPGIYVTIVPEGADQLAHADYFYTAESEATTKLQAPRTVGKHEVRIVAEQTQTVLFTRPIVLTEMKATLGAPGSAKAGSEIEVAWTGPNGKGDFVTVTLPDAEEGAYLNYFYANDTAEEGKGKLQLPEQAGSYELRYVTLGDKVIERKPIAVE